jgi:2-polyprenyl-6-methoxyphenol hydroxylase-like FAD-dependent oxidoreductase
MSTPSVLISGGGIAGATLAYWLGRYGMSPTVVERASGIRSSGSPVDVRGEAVDVAEEMGVMSRLRGLATQVTTLSFVDSDNRRIGAMGMPSAGREVEVARRDLAETLAGAAKDEAEFVYDDFILELAEDGTGVEVTLNSGVRRRFDLVVGADGSHSSVRGLAFGPEERFSRHLGMFVATVPLAEQLENSHEVLMYNVPGRAVSLHPAGGHPVAAFIFRGRRPKVFDHRDTAQHRQLVTDAYRNVGWRVPALLDLVRRSDELYLDAVSQVRLPNWSAGRIAVVGDAASSVSLFGDGSSLAVIGAKALADALARHPQDHAAAFRAYEAAHRGRVTAKHRNVSHASRLLVPGSRAGIAVRNLALRTLFSAVKDA